MTDTTGEGQALAVFTGRPRHWMSTLVALIKKSCMWMTLDGLRICMLLYKNV